MLNSRVNIGNFKNNNLLSVYIITDTTFPLHSRRLFHLDETIGLYRLVLYIYGRAVVFFEERIILSYQSGYGHVVTSSSIIKNWPISYYMVYNRKRPNNNSNHIRTERGIYK